MAPGAFNVTQCLEGHRIRREGIQSKQTDRQAGPGPAAAMESCLHTRVHAHTLTHACVHACALTHTHYVLLLCCLCMATAKGRGYSTRSATIHRTGKTQVEVLL